MFVCLFVCLLVCFAWCVFVCLLVCVCVCLLMCLFVCLFVCMYVCVFVCLCVCLCIVCGVCLFVCLLFCVYLCVFVCLCVCLFTCLLVSVSVSVYVRKLGNSICFDIAGFDTTGIGFIADNLILRNCKTEDWVMCKFLRLHKDRMIELAYFGKMLPEKVIMTAQGDERFELGNGIVFQSRFLVSHLTASHGDDRFDFTARVVLTHTNDIFEGKFFCFFLLKCNL